MPTRNPQTDVTPVSFLVAPSSGLLGYSDQWLRRSMSSIASRRQRVFKKIDRRELCEFQVSKWSSITQFFFRTKNALLILCGKETFIETIQKVQNTRAKGLFWNTMYDSRPFSWGMATWVHWCSFPGVHSNLSSNLLPHLTRRHSRGLGTSGWRMMAGG